jgi:hypothetical protein
LIFSNSAFCNSNWNHLVSESALKNNQFWKVAIIYGSKKIPKKGIQDHLGSLAIMLSLPQSLKYL